MKSYEKPVVLSNEEISEGIFAASGGGVEAAAPGEAAAGGNEDYGSKPGCDSKYMGGVFQAPKWSFTTNIDTYGCNGCVANRNDQSCVLSDPELEEPSKWASYRVDDGHRMPKWEAMGFAPNDMNYGF
jgi:hypothetical protein